jgi:hypothetical protein
MMHAYMYINFDDDTTYQVYAPDQGLVDAGIGRNLRIVDIVSLFNGPAESVILLRLVVAAAV